MKTIRTLLSVIILSAILGASFSFASEKVGASGVPGFFTRDYAGEPVDDLVIEDGIMPDSNEPVQLITSSPDGLTFEVRVPWEGLSLAPLSTANGEYLSVSLPGWTGTSEPGAPELPNLITQIGVPVGAGIEVSVVPGRSHVQTLAADVLPKSTQTSGTQVFSEDSGAWLTQDPTLVYEKDPIFYESQSDYPGVFVAISGDGYVRQQRVAGVAVYPVQYNPVAQEITVYESLRVTVKFTGSASIQSMSRQTDSEVYEQVLAGQLLNYEAARDWRLTTGSDAAIQSDSQITSSPTTMPNPGWRVKVREAGMYQLTYSELQAAGLPVGTLDPRSLQMFNLGIEIPIQVVGEADGGFDSSDVIRFYGEAIASKYTRENVYWLTYGDVGQGLRMTPRDVSPGSASTPGYYTASLHFEENNSYMTTANTYENFIWKQISITSSTTFIHTFSLSEPAVGPGALHVRILGYVSSYVNPDHHVKAFVNGVEVGELYWDGATWGTLEATVPSGVIQTGSNTISITAYLQPGMSYDVVFLDWIELDYANSFVAQNDRLEFGYESTGTWQFNVDGFTGDQVSVFDVTDPLNTQILTGTRVEPTASGYQVVFEDTLSAPADYAAVGAAGYLQAQAVEADTPSSLGETTNGADHLIITHAAFATAAGSLRDYRAAQGMRAMAVDVQDVYDEFNYGIVDPVAIKDFLAYTYNSWSGAAPSYVVLLGDGTYDPKNYLATGTTSFVPPYLLPVDPWMGETAADNRYVTLSGTDLMPDMMLGRISVNSAAEADAFVSKIMVYEAAPDDAWKSQVLAVADNADDAGNFASISDTLLSCCLPAEYDREKIYFGLSPYTDKTITQTAIKNSLNAGKLIVNYIGHGATASWAGESLFHSTYVSQLTNLGKYPVAVVMACMEGYYIRPETTIAYHAVGEVFTRAVDKGAIASWSATGQGVASGHMYLNHGFYDALFAGTASTVGEATLAGKLNLFSVGASPDLLDTYLLFGDPATVMIQQFRANDDAYTTEQDTALSVPAPGVLSNDFYSGEGTLSAVLVSDAGRGSVALSPNGAFVYTPDAGFSGSDSFTYQASDGGTVSNTATVTITVNAANSAPVANDDYFSTPQDTPLVVYANALMINDSDVDGDTLSVTGVSNPVNGTVLREGTKITFTPTTGFYGTAGFDYTLSDGDLTDVGHVTVNVVQEINDPPITQNIPDQTIVAGESFEVIMLDMYVYDPDDVDSTLTWTYSGNVELSVSIDGSRYATVSVPNGTWTGSETITFRVTDPDGLWDEDAATFTVLAGNQPPVVSDIPNQTVAPGESFAVINLDDYVADPDNLDSEISWTYSGQTRLAVSIDSNRVATISPPNKNWTGSETITFTASDPAGLFDSDSATFTVSTEVNHAPVAADDAYDVITGETLTVSAPGVLANDTDADSDPLTAVLVSDVANGSLTLKSDGSFTYTPNGGFIGSDSFTYKANDGALDSNTATVTIVVNEAPLPEMSIPLYTGWNLVSFYLQPESTAIADVLSSVEGLYDLVYAWDAQTGDWVQYDPDLAVTAPYVNDLQELDHTIGFWINMLQDSTLVLSGMEPATTEIALVPGWNLIGYPSIETRVLPDALESNGVTDYSILWAYHANDTTQWKVYDPVAAAYSNSLLETTPGWGYWINIGSNSTWNVIYDLP